MADASNGQAQPTPEGSAAPQGGAEDAKGGEGKEGKGGDHLNLKVKSQDGNEVFFKVKKTTEFRKVMNAYCKKVGAEPESVRFLFDGQRIQPTQTPEEISQTGGSWC